MNRKLKIMLIAGILAVTTLYAADNEPGTANDPLVTKSYVDKKIAEAGGTSSGANSSNLAVQLKAQEQLINVLTSQINELKQQSSGSFVIVAVPQGKTLFGKQGTEMIIRSGEATVMSAGAGGIQDITEGTDVNGGSQAPKYHLLLVPREDGRGLIANKALTVMVRGGYSLQ